MKYTFKILFEYIILYSLETLNIMMDSNENGLIEPLELGAQEWLNGRLISLEC